jgi:hypothetical protein
MISRTVLKINPTEKRGMDRFVCERVSKSFRTGRLQMVQLYATRCSCIAILWVSLVIFAAKTLCVSSQRVVPKVTIYFVIDSVPKLLDTPSYTRHIRNEPWVVSRNFINCRGFALKNDVRWSVKMEEICRDVFICYGVGSNVLLSVSVREHE